MVYLFQASTSTCLHIYSTYVLRRHLAIHVLSLRGLTDLVESTIRAL